MPEDTKVKLGKRPANSKYTPQRIKKLCAYIAVGLPYSHAAAAAGITYATLCEWRHDHPELQDKLREAEAQFMQHNLGIIDNAQDPQVSMKLLKARFPEHFSDGEKAVNVRMQVEGRIEHEAESLEQTLKRYAGAIQAVTGETIDVKCLPAGDPPEDGNRESVYPPAADGETG